MKLLFQKTLTGLFLFLHLGLSAQVRDDFNDGDFLNDPPWLSDSNFIIDNGRLRSNSLKSNNSFQMTTPSSYSHNCEWDIEIELQFNTSSANYCDVFIMADSANLAACKKAYYIRIGNSNDEVSLYRKDEKGSIRIIDGRDGRSGKSSNFLKIKLLRDSAFHFHLYIDSAGILVHEGEAIDSAISSSAYFGIAVTQSTSSFFKKHFFDNIYAGPVIRDTVPPTLSGIEVHDSSILRIGFSEGLKNFDKDNISFHPLQIDSVLRSGNAHYLIFLNAALPSGNYCLTVRDIYDSSGNYRKSDSITFPYVRSFIPGLHDLLIHEILPDPEPVKGLPAFEFIELRNTAKKHLSLKGTTLSDGSTTAHLPDTILAPDSFLILCSKDAQAFYNAYGHCAGLSPFPSLNNSDDILFLRNPSAELIHYISYSADLFKSNLKRNGGWSLEMIDISNPCDPLNWSESMNETGGTPGKENSARSTHPDKLLPFVTTVYPLSDSVIIVRFSESLDSLSLLKVSFFIDQNIGIKSILPAGPDFRSAYIGLSSKLKANIFYTIEVSSLRDCYGNYGEAQGLSFGLPEKAMPADLVINEILFNPRSGGSDFIELYNRSAKVIDLKSLRFTKLDANGNYEEIIELSDEGRLVLPGQYLAFTTELAGLKSSYYCPSPGSLIELPALPSMPDDEGSVILLHEDGYSIDSLVYNENMHYPLLDVKDGVSLERLNYNRSTLDRSNWSSASFGSGYATPGYKNSQYTDGNSTTAGISMESDVFTPDNDGQNDHLILNFRLNSASMVSIRIFNSNGIMVRNLVNSQLLGPEAQLSWDGFDDKARRLSTGIYVIYIELFDHQKLQERFRLSCVIAGQH